MNSKINFFFAFFSLSNGDSTSQNNKLKLNDYVDNNNKPVVTKHEENNNQNY